MAVQVIQAEGTIYMVLEYGDIDLARLLAKHEQARREGGGADELDENFIRLYWQQMLQVSPNRNRIMRAWCCFLISRRHVVASQSVRFGFAPHQECVYVVRYT